MTRSKNRFRPLRVLSALVLVTAVAACGGDDGGGAAVENGAAVEGDATDLFLAQENLAEGVEVTEMDCPDDVALDEGERFTCVAQVETSVTTFVAEVDYVVDEDGDLVMCTIRSEGDELFAVITPPCVNG